MVHAREKSLIALNYESIYDIEYRLNAVKFNPHRHALYIDILEKTFSLPILEGADKRNASEHP